MVLSLEKQDVKDNPPSPTPKMAFLILFFIHFLGYHTFLTFKLAGYFAALYLYRHSIGLDRFCRLRKFLKVAQKCLKKLLKFQKVTPLI